MNFLKNLFGGGTKPTEDRGLYFYVQPRRCKSIARVRIDPVNDISEDDEGTKFVRKDVRVSGCPFPAELHVTFDASRRVLETTVEGGELVTREAYEAWLTTQQQSSG